MDQTELLRRDQDHLIHPLHNRQLHENAHIWVKGEGAELIDADGKRYLDVLAGLWNVVAGHGRTELSDAASSQMSELAYCSGYAGSSNLQAIELAQRLAGMTYPSINRFFFTSGGGEATDSSVKTARFYWKQLGKPNKTKVISRQWGYHGVTLAAMSATGISGYWPMFEPRVAGFSHIPAPDSYRYTSSDGTPQGQAAADELEKAILHEGPDSVAMFIAEPIQGAGGVLIPPDDYFPRIREICDRYDVLLVADEVITGFRFAEGGITGHVGVTPDLVALGKVIGGGLPVGAYGGPEHIMQQLAPLGPVYQAGTLSGNPLAMAAGCATLDLLNDDAHAHLEALGVLLETLVTPVLARHGHPMRLVRQASLFWVSPGPDAPPRRSDLIPSTAGVLYADVHQGLLQRGYMLAPSAYEVGFLSTAHEAHHIEGFVAALDEVLTVLEVGQ